MWFTPETDPWLFRCPCNRAECDAPPVVPDLVARLEATRETMGSPLVVTSGTRCAWYNARVGGVSGSAHTRGAAADLACPTSQLRYILIKSAVMHFTRIGVGKTFVHVDVATRPVAQAIWLYGGVDAS